MTVWSIGGSCEEHASYDPYICDYSLTLTPFKAPNGAKEFTNQIEFTGLRGSKIGRVSLMDTGSDPMVGLAPFLGLKASRCNCLGKRCFRESGNVAGTFKGGGVNE